MACEWCEWERTIMMGTASASGRDKKGGMEGKRGVFLEPCPALRTKRPQFISIHLSRRVTGTRETTRPFRG